MKLSFLILLTSMSVLFGNAPSCNKAHESLTSENNKPMANGKIKIKIGAQTFTATLLHNSSAKAFREMLPLTLNMTELNGNEKYGDLANNLPVNPSDPVTINNGDLMVYGSKTLVLFYKTFSTSYSYTKLGSVDDVTGFTAALGSGNVSVQYEAE